MTVLRALEVRHASLSIHNVLSSCIALQVSDPYVLRQLINTAHIESQLLAATRREADQLLLSLNGGGVALAAELYRVVRFP